MHSKKEADNVSCVGGIGCQVRTVQRHVFGNTNTNLPCLFPFSTIYPCANQRVGVPIAVLTFLRLRNKHNWNVIYESLKLKRKFRAP
jgi:hypothetical protein